MTYGKRESDKCKILAVDDTPANLQLLIDMFDARVYTVLPARSAAVALSRLQADLPDMILLDINMPDMNGIELCRTIKRNPRMQDIPVLFISGRNDSDAVMEGFSAGGVDYISKPFRTNEVLARVNAHLMLRRYRDMLQRQNEELLIEVQVRQEREQEITRKNQELDASLRALQEAQGNLIHQAKMAGIGQLAAGVAHEINNPLGFVLSNHHTLQTYLERTRRLIDQIVAISCDDNRENGCGDVIAAVSDVNTRVILDDARELMLESAQGLERIRRIVASLLSFSGENTTGAFGYCSMREMIDTVLTISGSLTDTIDVVVENGGTGVVCASQALLEQALMNLFRNAVQAVKDRAGNLEGFAGRIRITTFETEDYIGCSVSDNGVPIAPELKDRIFEPFFTTRPVGSGTGLGLSTAYDIIVNKHHGRLYLEEMQAHEKTFTLLIPINRDNY